MGGGVMSAKHRPRSEQRDPWHVEAKRLRLSPLPGFVPPVRRLCDGPVRLTFRCRIGHTHPDALGIG